MYKPIIFFVAVIISLASSAKLNTDVQFQIELQKLSEFLGQEFHDLNDVKAYLETTMVQLKNEEELPEIAQKLLVEVERLYQILEEAEGPNDLVQLKKFGEAIEEVVGKIFLKFVENIEVNMPAIEEMITKLLEGFMDLISEGFNAAFGKPEIDMFAKPEIDMFAKLAKENEIN